jgi:hypothetical protein
MDEIILITKFRGVAIYAGGAVATSIFTTILSNVQNTHAAMLIPAAVEALGLPTSSNAALIAALPLGSAAVLKVPGITAEIASAARQAFQESYVIGLRITALSSLVFGIPGIIACICCKDIGHRMNDKTEVFLQDDQDSA